MDVKAAFPLGQKVDVFVTHVHDESGNFFVQINNEEAGKLDELMVEIESFISSEGSQGLTAGEIKVGAVYLAQYSEDARWYRARVLTVKAAICEVYFIDYGNTEQIPMKFLRIANPSFLNLPPQAFECALEDFSKFRGPHFQDAVSALKGLILEQELSCVTRSINSDVLVVNLYKDINCRDSIITHLLSQVQRTPQATTIEGHEPLQTTDKKSFKTISLSKGNYIDVCVTDVQDPHSFSCQFVKGSEALLDLMDEIAKDYEDLKPGELPLQTSNVGYPCCARFAEDLCWYRAVITNSSAVSSGFLEVKFVDYGNVQNTPVSDVKELKAKFLDLPAQTVECALLGIVPENKIKGWSTDAKTLFSKLTKDKHIVGEIYDKDSNTSKYWVKLVDTTGEMDMQVDQILIAAKYAEKVSSNFQDMTTPQSGQGSAQTSQQTSPQGRSKPEDAPRKAAFPYTKELLTPGKEEKVLVSSVTSPTSFYCMLYRTSTILEKLMSDIRRHYSRLGPEEEWLANPSVCDPCCAKFSEDQSWYRAVVTDILTSGKVEVLFVDYGNSERVSLKSIKKLAPQFSELPCQGIKCTLNRICPKGSKDWRSMDIKAFENLALECTGKLTVVALEDDELHRVELVVHEKGKDINLAESMLLKGNATLVEGAFTQSENLASVASRKFTQVTVNIGVYEDVFVSHVEDPGHFWCQLSKHQDDLNNVMTAVHEYCTASNDVIRNPCLGLACCAKYSEDEAWYRATITGIKKNNKVEVHFVDYGNYDQVSLSDLRMIKPEIMELPAQAFNCRLAQLDVTTLITFPPEAVDKFCGLTVDKELVLMIESFDKTQEQYLTLLLDGTENIFDTIAPLMPDVSSKEVVVPKQETKPGRKENVCVTTVNGLSDFFCQLMCSASHLDEMMINMDAHYKALAPDQERLSQPKAGCYCVGQYTEDDSWYRAKIVGSNNNTYDVVYIDFGNGESLPASRIKKLSQSFSQLPQQGFFCSFTGNNSEFSDSQFVELTLDKMFDLEVVAVENDDKAKVELYCANTESSLRDQLTKHQPEPLLKIQPNPLEVGITEVVFVALASSISKFYCQPTKTGDSLFNVMDKMYSYYESLEATQDAISNPQVGLYCAAKFTEDEGWYRAMVNTVHDNSVEVFYVDYGNSEVLSLERVKKLKQEFVELPAQAIQCSLTNAKNFSSAASSIFIELVSDPETLFELKIVSVVAEGIFDVELIKKESGESVHQILANEGLLQANEEHVQAPMASVSLDVGETHGGQCGHAASPSQFWFNLNSNVDTLNSLLEDMGVYYECLGPTECVLPSPVVGAYCCTQYSLDEEWYRAKITAVQGNQVDVHFVDFGNSESKPASSLKVLKEEFQALPDQAILCSLHQATPADGSTKWSPAAIQEFTDLVLEKEAVIRVAQKLPNNSYVVDVLDVSGSRDLVLGALVEKGLAANPSKIRDYKPCTLTFTEGGYIDVNPLICHSPHDFYCQVLSTDNIKTFGQLVYKMQDTYSKLGPNDNNLVKPEISTPCCAHYTGDGSWNRGKITQIVNENTVEVIFVDYGNQEVIPLQKVKCLLPEFTDLPVQCVQCCLSDIKPNNGAKWSDKAKERFAELVNQKQLVAKPVSTVEGTKMEVTLFDTSDDTQDINIGETLVNEGLAAWVSSSSTEQRPKIVMKTLESLETLKVSSGDVLYISAVDSPDRIYCQMAGTEEKLDNLITSLISFYESPQARELSVQSVAAGQVCAALFSQDNTWYRAVATNVSSANVTVRFIDYGNTETISLNNIKILAEEFTKEPILAVQCKLSGVQPSGGIPNWSKEASAFLENAGGDNGFKVKVIASGDTLEVKLCDQQGDLSDRLVKEGLAEARQKETAKPVQKHSQSSPKQSSKPQTFQSPDIQVGRKIEVFVTDITSPGLFCCQLAEFGDDLNQMMDSIYDHYSKLDDTVGCLVSPVVGQPCVAIFEGDGSWYRAVVQTMTLKDLNVKFVDYGNSQTVKPYEVKQIEPRYMKLQKLAIECAIDFQRSDWSKEETEKFTAVVGDDKRTAEIVKEENGRYLVKIYQDSKCITDSFFETPATPEIPEQVLQPNQVEDVYVAYLSSSTQLCLQLSKHSDALDELMAVIDQSCSGSSTSLKEVSVDMGMSCCALFEDGWYRAVVMSRPSAGQVDVHYIDYGNNATVPLSDLRALPESCLKLPKQAISCTLNNPKLAGVSKETVENAVMDRQIKAKFIKQEGNNWLVELEIDGVDVADSLLGDSQPTKSKMSTFTEQDISENSNAQVYVSHTVSLDEFYLQMGSSTEVLESLSTRLNASYPGSDRQPLDKLELGSVCCAQFSEDSSWYRSIVTAISDDRHVEVQFVDYGNSDKVERSNVLVLKEEFMDIPALAIKCSLEVSQNTKSDKDIERFETLVYDQELNGVFLHKNAEKWQVQLNKDGNSIVNLLQENQKKAPKDTSVPHGLTSIIQDKEILAGQEFECVLSHVEETGSFYIQMNADPLLDKVTDMISEIYPSLGPSDECLKDCKVGVFCCVKFSEDGQWYRAVVNEILSDSEAKVTFIDFGNSEVTAIASMKSLRPEFFEISKLAIPCRLDSTKDNWSEADTLMLDEKMLEKTLNVTFVSAAENEWNVVVNVDGACLNTLPEFTATGGQEPCSFTAASFNVNKKEPVTFLTAESLDCIWLQPKNTEDDLSTLMNEIAESKPSRRMDVSEISVCKPCLAQFTEDDEWYRAKVIDIIGAQILVKYVDYGNSEQIDATRISPISPLFTQLPTQAVKVCVVDVPEANTSHVLNKLNEEYPETTLMAEVVNQNDTVYSVRLFDQDGQELVKKLMCTNENNNAESKEPVAAVDVDPIVSQEEAPTEAVDANEMKAVEDRQELEPDNEELFEAQENVNESKASGSSSDSLAETTLPVASEEPSTDATPASNTPDDSALQSLDDPHSKYAVAEPNESALSGMEENSRDEVTIAGEDETSVASNIHISSCNQLSGYDPEVYKASEIMQQFHHKASSDELFEDTYSKSSSDKISECQEDLQAPNNAAPEFQEDCPSGTPKDAAPESQKDLPSQTPKDAARESQEDLPSEIPKDAASEIQEDLPSETSKDAAPESQEDLPSETPKDAAPESQENLPSETPKDAVPESQEDLPSETPKDAASEIQEDLPSETPKDAVPESQEDLPSETPKDAAAESQEDLASETPKDAAPESQEDLPSETPKDAAPESQENLPSETPKDAAPESQEDLPSETPKDAAPESQEDLSSGTPKDVAPEIQEDLPSETPKDAAPESQENLPSETPKDAAPESQENLPSETPKNAAPESQENLPSEKPKDAAPENQEDLPSETPKDATPESQEDLPSETPKDAAPESQEDLPSETPKDAAPENQENLPSETPKDAAPESQEDLPSETPKDAAPESQEDLPSETPKDAAPESQEDLPSETPKDAAAESKEDLPSETPKDAAPESQEDLPSETPKDAAPESQENLPPETPKDAAPESQENLPSETPKDAAAESQEDLPPETPKDAAPESQENLPSETPKDAAAESQEDLPSETPKDAAPESQENLPSETPKDAAAESQEDLPSETPKDAVPESQEDLPSETPKDATPECQEDFPSETPKDATPECQEDLPSETPKDATPECQEDLPSEIPKDATPECQENLSSDTTKDTASKCQEDLLSKPSKDSEQESQENLPSETPKDAASESQEDLPSETPKDAEREDKEDLASDLNKDASEHSNMKVAVTNGIQNSSDLRFEMDEECLSDEALEKLDAVLEQKPSAVNQVSGGVQTLGNGQVQEQM